MVIEGRYIVIGILVLTWITFTYNSYKRVIGCDREESALAIMWLVFNLVVVVAFAIFGVIAFLFHLWTQTYTIP